MAVKVPKQEFHEQVLALIKDFSEGLRTHERAHTELARIFGDDWVEKLEDTLCAERLVCVRCNQDWERIYDMSNDGKHCHRCAEELQEQQARNSLSLINV